MYYTVTMSFFNKRYKKNPIYRISLLSFCVFFALCSISFTSVAAGDRQEDALLRKELPIQSNDIPGWPTGPEITAQSAIVMEAGTGTILYSKNIHEELYPASTTKIMTCLLAVENASLSDTVTFTSDAIFSVPAGGSNIGMDVGQSITLEQALYGIMVGSANEVANAVGEHVSGSIDAFVRLMNDRAKELGCTNTHFANTNGLQADDHYTSAYDLALISRAFFDNELLCKVGNTPRYHFVATSNQPDDFYLNNKHKLITGEIPCEGIMGGKTGYTDLARETLVTCAERNGLKLICVVFMEESPAQFTDTVTLLDYGFNNFQSVNVAENDTRYMPDDAVFFESDNDVFGHSGTILRLSRNDNIIIPKTQTIEDSDYEISYDLTAKEKADNPTAIARVSYSYHGEPVGAAYVCYSAMPATASKGSPSTSRTIYINVKLVLICVGILFLLFAITGAVITRILDGRHHSSRNDRVRYNRRKKEYKKKKNLFM